MIPLKSTGLALIAAVLLMTSGCGFKLQRSYSIPASLEQLHLSSTDKYSELSRLVADRLRVNRISLIDADEKQPILRLISDTLERSTLSLYPTGNVAEYELIYHVHFSVAFYQQDPQEFDVEIRRDYQDDPRTALAKSREMELLVKEMRIQAADNIIQTLSSIEAN